MDLGDLKNSKWISWSDLARRWMIRDFELLRFLQERLQPYSENGLPLGCPSAHHAYHHLSNEHSSLVGQLKMYNKGITHDNVNDVLPRMSEGEGKAFNSKEWMKTKKDLQKRKTKILAEMKVIAEADSGLTSWKYFVTPSLQVDFEEIINDLRKKLFRLEEVVEFERSHDIQPYDIGKRINRETVGRLSLRPSQWKKLQSRQIADKLWKEDPMITIAAMIRHPDLLEVTKRPDGDYYLEKTVREWIKDLCPNRSPGRRPARDKSGAPSNH